ncbi:MAG: hypothetical protein ACOYOU_00715 [Kiritimatiellia bacterium]
MVVSLVCYSRVMFAYRGRLFAILMQPWFPPVLAGIVFHLPVLFCAFVYDDVSLVAEHPRLGSASFLGEIWQRDYGQEFVGENRGFYRPVFMTLLMALRMLFGTGPLFFHLFSLAVFCLAIYLVVRVAAACESRRTGILPLAAGVLYAVHPARVETVSLVMSLPDLLVECGALGMILLLLKAVRGTCAGVPVAGTARAQRRGYAAVAWCGALAMLAALCKESAFFVVPALLGTAAWFAMRAGVAERKRVLSAAGLSLMALAVVFLLRNAAHVQPPVPVAGTIRALLTGGRAEDSLLTLLLALRDVVIPGPVVFWRNVTATHLPGAAVVLVALGVVIVGGWLVALRRRNLALALLVAWCGANAANLVLLAGAGYVYSQRYLAFAPVAILLCLAIGVAVNAAADRWPLGSGSSPRYGRLLVLGASAYLTALGAFSLAGSSVCLTPKSFFLAMQRANPADVVPLGAVAEMLNREWAQAEEVEQCIRAATALDRTHPQVPRLQNMLIQRYLADGRFADALRCADWSLGIYTNDADKIVLRATALANLGRPDVARQEVGRVLARDPRHAAARQLMEQIVQRQEKVMGQ